MGSILYCIGLIGSSFAPTASIWYITYGIIFSLGNSAVYLASLLIIRHHFELHYAFATGLAGSGVGFGGLFLAKFLEILIEHTGLRTTLRIMASFGIIQFGIGLTYKGRSVLQAQEQKSSLDLSNIISNIIDFKIWKNGAYVIWNMSISTLYFVFYIPYVHLVSKTSLSFILGIKDSGNRKRH